MRSSAFGPEADIEGSITERPLRAPISAVQRETTTFESGRFEVHHPLAEMGWRVVRQLLTPKPKSCLCSVKRTLVYPLNPYLLAGLASNMPWRIVAKAASYSRNSVSSWSDGAVTDSCRSRPFSAASTQFSVVMTMLPGKGSRFAPPATSQHSETTSAWQDELDTNTSGSSPIIELDD